MEAGSVLAVVNVPSFYIPINMNYNEEFAWLVELVRSFEQIPSKDSRCMLASDADFSGQKPLSCSSKLGCRTSINVRIFAIESQYDKTKVYSVLDRDLGLFSILVERSIPARRSFFVDFRLFIENFLSTI